MSSQFSSYPERLRQFKYDSVNHLIVSELLNVGFPHRSKPLLKWSGHKTIWVTRSNNDDLWLPIASPFLLPLFLIPDNSDVVTLQVLSRVTSCVTIHHMVTLYPRMRMLECVDVGIVMIGPHKVPRDLLSRSRVSHLLSKLQSKILNSRGQNKE